MKKIDQILMQAYEQKASDVHLTVDVPPVFRIDGKLKNQGTDIVDGILTVELAKEILSHDDWERFVEDGEIDLSYGIEGISRFRVNIFKQRGQVALAIRLLSTKIPTVEQLGLPQVLKKLVTKSQGMILVTGPTGSGKSTTLAAMVDYLNKETSKHIITLEDPIEYIHQHQNCIIDQREIGQDTKAFAKGLRASLRQDPDVILVGELRDLETIQTAITAAETGHLVLATLHTTSAATTIDRIIDVFEPAQQMQIRIQLASVLVGVCSQRLFPLVGQPGRVAATEILINTPAVSNLIRSEKVHQITNVLQTSKSMGMHTLEMNMKEFVQRGMISPKDVQAYLTGDFGHGAV